MDQIFTWLLVFVPIAATANALNGSPALIFFLSAIAIVPLAKFIGDATEALASRTSAAWGGLINVTLGNATELILGIFALRAGLIDVVKATITGSIIGNLLLVLGTALMAGGLRFKKQEFNRTAAQASGSTLFLAVVALIVPAVLPAAAPGTTVFASSWLSLFVAAAMIAMYAGTLIFSLHTHKHLYVVEELPSKEADVIEAKWSTQQSIFILLLATLGVTWMSNLLVGYITPVAQRFGWTDLFIGVVVVAIVGNVAEHASAVTMALKNKMTLAIQIAIGSATQVAMFVAPALVFISYFMRTQMDLIFNAFELTSILLSVIIVNMVTSDGESNWLEGLQLLIAYLIMAVAFFVHP